jgi:hypothetical protein
MSKIDADYEALWRKLQSAIQSRDKSGENEFVVYTKLRPRRRNHIQIHDDYLLRQSDQAKSIWQTIPKEEVLFYAEMAIEAGDSGFCIKDVRKARMGSIICAMLDLLDEFEYRPGQLLYYRGALSNSATQTSDTAAFNRAPIAS